MTLAAMVSLILTAGMLAGWMGNYFVNTNYYQAAQQQDQAGQLHFVLGLPYEIESWMDVDEALQRAADVSKFASTRVMPRWIKILFDGTVETGTGIVDPLYPDGHQGIANWTEDELTELTRKANAKGLTLHVHVMGNKGIRQVVNAFINGGKDEMRNTLVHVRNADAADLKRMAEHNIHVAAGMLWHHYADFKQEIFMTGIMAVGVELRGYPIKSFFDYGVNAASHSDFPALSDSPDDPFSIMEIMVTGIYQPEKAKAWWTEECLTREQALTALTINVAKQMFIENERGRFLAGICLGIRCLSEEGIRCQGRRPPHRARRPDGRSRTDLNRE